MPFLLALVLTAAAWRTRRVPAGTGRYGWFDVHGREYEIFAWTGRKASRRGLAALARALASVEGR